MYNIKNNKNGIKVDGKSNYRIVQEQKKIKDIIQDFWTNREIHMYVCIWTQKTKIEHKITLTVKATK